MNFPNRFTLPAMLPTRWVLNLATIFKLGQKLPAPGTWGTLIGIVLYVVFFHKLGVIGWVFWLGILTFLAVIICGEAEVRLQKRDPSEVILDEVVAVPYCFIGLYPVLEQGVTWVWVLAAFLIFRFFDILKPLGINRLQNMQGGMGVVVDDLAAAIATCFTLHILVFLAIRYYPVLVGA